MAVVVKTYDTRAASDSEEAAEEQELVRVTFEEIKHVMHDLKDRIMKGEILSLKYRIERFDEDGNPARVWVEYEELTTREELHEG